MSRAETFNERADFSRRSRRGIRSPHLQVGVNVLSVPVSPRSGRQTTNECDQALSPASRGVHSALLVCLILVSLTLTGCRPEQEMASQPSYKPYQSSEFFEDGMSARPLVDGTVSRGSVDRDPFLMTGKVGGVTVDRFPFEVTEEVIVRGRERYDAYCSMCHGRDGYGQGMVVRRGFNRPPSLHDPAIRQKAVGHYFDVMTNGYGAMPPHGSIVAVTDRWAIASYLRALQLSQGAGSPAPAPPAAPAATPALNAPAQPEVSR